MKKILTFLAFLALTFESFGVITVSPTTIDSGYCQHTYRFKVVATGGRAPYAFTISSGSLPAGLFINKGTGVISGTINLTRDTAITFTAKAMDALLAYGTRAYTMYITNKVVTWVSLYPAWNTMPNTYPTNATVYDTYRLYSLGASSNWTQGGTTVTSTKYLGTIDSFDLPFITNNVERARIYADGRGVNVSTALYLRGNKFLYQPANQTGNLSIGYLSGNSSTQAIKNTGVGKSALSASTTGDFCTAVGYEALKDNTTGYDNTAVGQGALTANTVGYFNTAVGTEAGNTANAYFLTAVGYGALKISTGNQNSALGTEALTKSTTGYDLTAVGYRALYNSTTGTGNTALGASAGLANTDGYYNTYIGHSSGSTNVGVFNTFLGAGSNGTGLSNNVIITDGSGAIKFRTTATNEISIVSDSVSTSVATASTNKIKIKVNGVTYYFLVTTAP